jgi:hypothetical protein
MDHGANELQRGGSGNLLQKIHRSAKSSIGMQHYGRRKLDAEHGITQACLHTAVLKARGKQQRRLIHETTNTEFL